MLLLDDFAPKPVNVIQGVAPMVAGGLDGDEFAFLVPIPEGIEADAEEFGRPADANELPGVACLFCGLLWRVLYFFRYGLDLLVLGLEAN